ncbi:hypothetical protein SS50377_27308 [Spironucleus salmonicida]|uniref:Uncharacterized protein n=1 Tax=Spironucleus salmonicida TaxID=348837 RepID=V6LFR8_9EUKA|nr:hypothetical protein SS50377_27301 [Spironucleus salmonicida]KAH0571014.1 hypothetical protein SS50377_27308 [Spironucleus salmonicida]|eukprot:EST43390.1 Hypothetical protein SS50377_17071 [Spironucleus salmonicida]
MDTFIDQIIAQYAALEFYKPSQHLESALELRLETAYQEMLRIAIQVRQSCAEEPVFGVLCADFTQVRLLKRLISDDFIAAAVVSSKDSASARTCRNALIPVFQDQIRAEEMADFEFDGVFCYEVPGDFFLESRGPQEAAWTVKGRWLIQLGAAPQQPPAGVECKAAWQGGE